MAYFSNGSEGMDYEARYCDRCIHQGSDDGPGCPIWLLHMLWNYDACNKGGETPEGKAKYTALNILIPQSKDGGNEQCKMFSLAGSET